MNRKDYKLQAKRDFENVIFDRGWAFHRTGYHETRLNANKLSIAERFMPSYRIDRQFKDLTTPIIWVEVKACNQEGLIRIQKDELAVHLAMDGKSPVYYALYNPDNAFFRIIPLSAVRHSLEDEGGHYSFSWEDIEETPDEL